MLVMCQRVNGNYHLKAKLDMIIFFVLEYWGLNA